jgi:hypothetical protein
VINFCRNQEWAFSQHDMISRKDVKASSSSTMPHLFASSSLRRWPLTSVVAGAGEVRRDESFGYFTGSSSRTLSTPMAPAMSTVPGGGNHRLPFRWYGGDGGNGAKSTSSDPVVIDEALDFRLKVLIHHSLLCALVHYYALHILHTIKSSVSDTS